MRKTRAISILLATFMTMTMLANLTACQEPVPGGTNVDFEDLVPENYGEWDGNYIYRGNVKSKTTGENAEYLVQSVELDGNSYSVNYCNDYDIADQTIYMTLSLNNSDYSTCLVAYDVAAKEQTLIFHKFVSMDTLFSESYFQYELYYVEQILQNGDILVSGIRRLYNADGQLSSADDAMKNMLFIIDKFGTVVEEISDDYLQYTRVSEEYWQKYDYADGSQKLYARGFREEPVLVYDLRSRPNHTYTVTFVEKNGAVGYLIETWRDKKEGEWSDRFIKLEFFDLKQKKLSTLFESETDRYAEWVAVPNKEILFLYDYKEFDYKTRDSEGTYTAQDNIRIVVIEYTKSGVIVRDEGAQWSGGKTYEIEAYDGLTGNAYARVHWTASASGCDSGGYKNEYWEISVRDSSNKRVLKQDQYESALESVKNVYYAKYGVEFGDYVYYTRYQRLRNTIIGQARSAYMFQRYTRSANKTDTMQLWMNGNYTEANEKYCSMMWDYNGSVSNEFIISKN